VETAPSYTYVTETVVVTPSKRQRRDDRDRRETPIRNPRMSGGGDSYEGGGTIADFLRAKEQRDKHHGRH
jgi:hypothetical protein